MQLAIDIGNTRTKIGVFEATNLLQVFTLNTTEEKAHQSSWRFIQSPISHAIISSVRTNNEHIPYNIKSKALTFTNSMRLPIEIQYKTPDTLGKDRICNAVGGQITFPGSPVLILDMGTCIKFDCVDVATNTNTYLGGSISPGLQMRAKAMHAFTGKLPLIQTNPMQEIIGTDTFESMNSGIYNGILQEINGFIEQYLYQFPDLKMIGTGGDFKYFADALKNTIFADDFLTLKGLNQILLHNL